MSGPIFKPEDMFKVTERGGRFVKATRQASQY
jgi:hypothetical protein